MEKIRIHMGRMSNRYGTDVTTIVDDPVKPQYGHDTVIKILMHDLDFTPMDEDYSDRCEGFYDEGVEAYFDYDGYIDVDIPQSIIERVRAEMEVQERYYDVVVSVYEESEDGLDYRVDSHLLCGGFATEDEAMEYINTHDCTEYDDVGKTNLYTCIEIEEHDENGSVTKVITVD